MERRIGIVGGGVSGLLACKYVLSKGYHPIVFESQNKIGGVWTNTLENTKLQTTKSHYQFSDFPWPSSMKTPFPYHHQVLDYIQSYAKHFDLLKHIRFNTKVVSIKYEGASEDEIQSWNLWNGNGKPFSNNGKWFLTIRDLLSQSWEVMHVDFVILCVGRYSGVPNLPICPIGKGPEVCKAKVIHSMDYSSMDYESARSLVRGKQVTVVGFGKTALDIAMQCVAINGKKNPCTLIYRNVHWHIPEYMLWRFPLAYLYLNRFAELWVRKPSDGLLVVLLALILWPLKWAICKGLERHVKRMNRLEKLGLVPQQSFLEGMNACMISTVPQGFYDKVEEGSIILRNCSSLYFSKDGVLLSNDFEPQRLIKGDLVILATGFKGEEKVINLFPSPIFQDCIRGPNSNTLAPLYRECIHPRIPQLAIIGFTDSVASLYSSELKCRWLAELFGERFKVPSIQEMEEDISTMYNVVGGNSKKQNSKTCIGALHIWCNDKYCKDMGWKPRRKNGFWAEWFEPYGPMDYSKP